MNTRFLAAALVLALSMPVAPGARAQNTRAADAPLTEPYAVAGRPDACKLLPRSDLEALFPGQPVGEAEPTLSAIYKGPQYVERCMYVVKLPSATSDSNTSTIASINIISWGEESKNPTALAKDFARFRDSTEKVVAGSRFPKQIETVSNVGDEAFQEISEYNIKIYLRKDDLFFTLTLDKHSTQSQPNAVALAKQAASRWSGGVGVVEATIPIARNKSVEIPPDTRVSQAPPVDRWPDACALLTVEDVFSVFSDMNVSQPRKTMGKITHMSRVDRVEEIPNPVGCSYDADKKEVVDGKRDIIFNSIRVYISEVSLTPEAAKRYFSMAGRIGKGDVAVPGLGDEATLTVMNEINMRKGLINVSVRVGGGQRDQAQYADARKRVMELAKIVVGRLP